MNPVDPQGPNGINGSNSGDGSLGSDNNLSGSNLGGSNLGGSNLGGMQPSTPAVGASSTMTDPMAGGGQGGDAGRESGTMAKVKDEAVKLRGQATDRARSAAEDGKLRATETLDGFARSIHDVAGNLEEQVGPQLARYAHRAADTLDEFSSSLRNKSVDELVDDARSFVRRSPAIAIGAAVAVGFALSRFLKATSTDGQRAPRNAYAIDDDDDDMPTMTSDRTGGSQPRYNA